jgi:hypothetical protein
MGSCARPASRRRNLTFRIAETPLNTSVEKEEIGKLTFIAQRALSGAPLESLLDVVFDRPQQLLVNLERILVNRQIHNENVCAHL